MIITFIVIMIRITTMTMIMKIKVIVINLMTRIYICIDKIKRTKATMKIVTIFIVLV